MYANIHQDPNLTVNESYSRGAGEDGGQRVDRQVDKSADASTDRHVQVSAQDRGEHAQRHLSAARRKRLRTAALPGLLGVLLVAAVTVLSRLYISVVVEKQKLQTSLLKLQTSLHELQTSHNKSNCQFEGGESWKRFRCSCYYKSTERKNWTASRRDCQDRGADLVIINSREEDVFVGQLNEGGTSWIGLSVKTRKDWELKSEWKWVDESEPGYLGWRTDVNIKPVKGSAAHIDQKGMWNHSSEGLKTWICERPMP